MTTFSDRIVCTPLIGFKVVIHSDHKNLSFNIFKSERVRRWLLLLEEYDYTFVYTPGKENFIADLISRYPIHHVPLEDTANLVLDDDEIDNNDNIYPIDYAIIAKHQATDATLKALLNTPGYEQLQIQGHSLISFNRKICLPATLVDRIIIWYHEILGHLGPYRTFKTISIHFHYRGMEAVSIITSQRIDN